MALKEYFETNIQPAAEALDRTLGIQSIHVREEHHSDNIEVTRYIKVLNPFNEVVFITPDQLNKYTSLGLSIRRVV